MCITKVMSCPFYTKYLYALLSLRLQRYKDKTIPASISTDIFPVLTRINASGFKDGSIKVADLKQPCDLVEIPLRILKRGFVIIDECLELYPTLLPV